MKKPKTIDELLLEVQETMHEARKRREKKTLTVLQVKEYVNNKNYKILRGTLARKLVHAEIQQQECGCCHQRQNVVTRLVLIHEDSAGNHYIKDKDSELTNASIYSFHNDLPLKFRITPVTIPRCFNCVMQDFEMRGERADESVA